MGGWAQPCQPILYWLFCFLPSWEDGQNEGCWSACYRVESIQVHTVWTLPDLRTWPFLIQWGPGVVRFGGEQDSEENRGESEPHIYNCPCSSKNH